MIRMSDSPAACGGATARKVHGDRTVTFVLELLPNMTERTFSKCVPDTVTTVPPESGPLFGVTDEMRGGSPNA